MNALVHTLMVEFYADRGQLHSVSCVSTLGPGVVRSAFMVEAMLWKENARTVLRIY